MAVAKQQAVPRSGAHSLDDSVHALGDLGRSLTARRRMGPHGPPRNLFADLAGGHTLIRAVVPLREVLVDTSVGEAREFGAVPSPLPRAAQHQIEGDAAKPWGKGPRHILPDWSQRQVGCGGVTMVATPLRLTVAH